MKSEMLSQGDGTVQRLSALWDGETGDGTDATVALCAAWAQDKSLAADWYAWSLISDVMRSEDLADVVEQDEAFLQSLRKRLLEEPVVLAPAVRPTAADLEPHRALPEGLSVVARPRRQVFRRVVGGVLAAGTMVVAGVLVLGHQDPAKQDTGAQMAQALPDADALQSSPPMVMRSPELDRYLNAHREFAQSPAMAGPGGVRQVALTPDGR